MGGEEGGSQNRIMDGETWLDGEGYHKMVDLFAPRNTRALIKFVQDTGRCPRLFYAL